MTQRKNYSQRYPLRAKIQATIATIALIALALPYLPKISVTVQPVYAQPIERGSGR